jgi:hypothetical protein
MCCRALVVGALAIALSACSTSNPKAIGPPPTVATTTSTTTVAERDAAILARWTEAYRASIAASKDPTSPGLIAVLSDYFSDSALDTLLSSYAAYARDGLTSVGDIDLGKPSVVSVDGSTAIVVSCEVNRLGVIYVKTGMPLPGAVGSTAPVLNGVRSTLTIAPSGLWKVSSATWKDGSCDGI